MNQVRYLYEAEMGTKKAKNIKEVKKMLGRRSKSHQNMLKEVWRAELLLTLTYLFSFTGRIK